MLALGVILSALIAVILFHGVKTHHDRFGFVVFTDISESQLEMHQKFTIQLAERAHLDPTIRQMLKHQLKVLKTVGVAGREAIDITPAVTDKPADFKKIGNTWKREGYEDVNTLFGEYQKDSEDEGA